MQALHTYLPSLHLTNNLARLAQRLHHLRALLSATNRVVALLEQVVEFRLAVHLLEEFALHFVLGVLDEGQHDGFGDHVDHGAADDVVVGCDEEFWFEKSAAQLPLGEEC